MVVSALARGLCEGGLIWQLVVGALRLAENQITTIYEYPHEQHGSLNAFLAQIRAEEKRYYDTCYGLRSASENTRCPWASTATST